MIVQNVSWRWVFYVNLPAGLIALAVLASTLPTTSVPTRPAIDYAGTVVLATAVTAIVLIASLGGSTWPWRSTQVILAGAIAVLLLVSLVPIERKAREPIQAAAVLHNDVFRIAALLSLIAGFELFGSLTFLPLFFQTVFRSRRAMDCG